MTAGAGELLRWIAAAGLLDGAVVVASISGGKDSAALSLLLHELGIEHRRIFCDTGWEKAETYEYLQGPLQDAIGEIEVLRNEKYSGMADLIRSRGMFPSRLIRFCTQELKAVPAAKYLKSLAKDGARVINAIGIRRGESAARSRVSEWEWQDYYGALVWRPLVDWSEEDVIDMHRRHGLPPNPLYLKGASRVGCWPCIHARKAEIRLVAELDQERIAAIRDLEEEVGDMQEARAAGKGVTLAELGRQRATYFHTHRKDRSLKMVPIDEAVQWSRTSRGGRQLELFEPPAEERGCMRWGLCDSVTDS